MGSIQLTGQASLVGQPMFQSIILAPKAPRTARLRAVDASLRFLTGGAYTLASTKGQELFEHLIKETGYNADLAQRVEKAGFRRLIGIQGAAEMSDFLEQELMEYIFRNQAIFSILSAVHIGLNTTDPTDADSGTEVSGVSYARVSVNTTSGWAAPGATGGSTNNVGAVTFPTAGGAWGTVTHFKGNDAATTGNMLFHSGVDASKSVDDGDTAEFAATVLVVTAA